MFCVKHVHVHLCTELGHDMHRVAPTPIRTYLNGRNKVRCAGAKDSKVCYQIQWKTFITLTLVLIPIDLFTIMHVVSNTHRYILRFT